MSYTFDRKRSRRTALVVLFLIFSAASTQGADDKGVRPAPAYDNFVPPAVGQSYTDTVFGVSIKRVSNSRNMTNNAVSGPLTFVSTEYPTASPFNSDNSRLILQHAGYFGLYDGSGTYLRDLAFSANAATEPRWSRTDPNALYYVSGNSLMKLNVETGVSTVVRAFTEYAAIRGRGESEISLDGDHMVFAADELPGATPGVTNRYVFVYQISTNTKGAVLDTLGHLFNQLYLAPNNNVAIGWLDSGSARFAGVELFDRNMVFQRQLTRAIGHMHLTRDTNGDDLLIWTNSSDPQPIASCENGVVKVRLSDARQTCLLQLDWSLAVHITAPDGNGWVFVETYAPSEPPPLAPAWKLYSNEILQVKLDGSETRRLLHHRSRQTANYGYQPRAAVSRDGSRLVFTSNYGLQGILGYPFTYTDAYFVAIPNLVPPRLSIDDAGVVEGDAGTQNLMLTMRLSYASDLTITASYTVDSGAASPGVDFHGALSGTVTFAPGETSKTLTFTVSGDTAVEANEAFTVNVTSATNTVIEDGQGLGTILNDEGPPGAAASIATQIGQTVAVLNGTVSPGGKSSTAFFEYGTTTAYGGLSAAQPSPGSGYWPAAVNGAVSGLACSTRYHFRVTATSSAGTTSSGDATFVTAPCDGLSIDDPVVIEGHARHSLAAFTIHVSPPSPTPLTFGYRTASGSAASGGDYVAASGVFTIPAGAKEKTLLIAIVGDADVEPDESLSVILEGVTGVTATKSVGTATILNDDSPGAATNVVQYRLYHDGTKEHLYTTDFNEYVVLGTRGWIREGVAYRMLTTGIHKGAATIPLFRLYHDVILQHHWTTDANEVKVLAEDRGWVYEGVVGYLAPAQVEGTVPLYRMALAYPPLHLWTTDLNEYNVLAERGWVREGIIGFVVP
jgi:hypothetical protein